jgi:hypothetical protein
MTTQESTPTTGRVMRKHSQEFKLTAVKRVLAGESAHVVARDLTVAASLLSIYPMAIKGLLNQRITSKATRIKRRSNSSRLG